MFVDIDLRPVTVLIVDASQYARSHLKAALQSFGIRNIVECADGPGAIEILKERPVDLVLADHDIEPMDVVQFVRFVRSGGVVAKPEVPIIVVAADADLAKVMVLRNVGLNEYLVRPFSNEALYRRLRAILVYPRAFVRAAGYVGPCRRSVERSAPEKDRRRNPPLPRPQPVVRPPAAKVGQPAAAGPAPAAGQQNTSHRDFKAGELIFREGQKGEEAYVVEKGRVEIFKTGADGLRVVLGELTANGIFGEMALIDDEPRMASAVAAEDTTCLVIPKAVLRSQVTRSPELVTLVLDSLLDYIRHMGRDLVQVRARLAKG